MRVEIISLVYQPKFGNQPNPRVLPVAVPLFLGRIFFVSIKLVTDSDTTK